MEIERRKIVDEVIRRVVNELGADGAGSPRRRSGYSGGVFADVEEAISAAGTAFSQLRELPLETRAACVTSMRQSLLRSVDELSEMAVKETGMGRIAHKRLKNRLAINKTPGPEFITPQSFTGDHGFSLEERPPYGVVGVITPSTNPSETVINNGIAMFSAGNGCVFNGHPSASAVTARTVEIMNSAIMDAGGPENAIACVRKPTKESAVALMKHPGIRLLTVTGGPEIVKIAMKSGKKVVAAGPGNPPAIVDRTADIKQAARDLIAGAGLDNNIVCIAEKEIIVEEPVAGSLVKELEASGAVRISEAQLNRLMNAVSLKTCTGELAGQREFVGRNANVILDRIGVRAHEDTPIAIAEVGADHPLVHWEQLMPIIPIVRVRDFDKALALAYEAEGGRFHTAVIHSMNVDHMSRMARLMNCTVFVKNGPCSAGLGLDGEGYTSWTLASPTGEGYTNPLTFTRHRRCVLKDYFRII